MYRAGARNERGCSPLRPSLRVMDMVDSKRLLPAIGGRTLLVMEVDREGGPLRCGAQGAAS